MPSHAVSAVAMENNHEHQERERQVARRFDAASVSAWRHPGEQIDRAERQSARRTEIDLLEATVRLYQELLPLKAQCGGERRWRSGYFRLCAYVYRIAPATFGGLTGREIAASLGIHYSAWKKHLVHVDRRLGGARH